MPIAMVIARERMRVVFMGFCVGFVLGGGNGLMVWVFGFCCWLLLLGGEAGGGGGQSRETIGYFSGFHPPMLVPVAIELLLKARDGARGSSGLHCGSLFLSENR